MASSYHSLTDTELRNKLIDKGYDIPVSVNRDFIIKKLSSLSDGQNNARPSPFPNRRKTTNFGRPSQGGAVTRNGHEEEMSNSQAKSKAKNRLSLNEASIRKQSQKSKPDFNSEPATSTPKKSLSEVAAAFSSNNNHLQEENEEDDSDYDLGPIEPPRSLLSPSGSKRSSNFVGSNISPVQDSFSTPPVSERRNSNRYEQYLSFFRSGSSEGENSSPGTTKSRLSTPASSSSFDYSYNYISPNTSTANTNAFSTSNTGLLSTSYGRPLDYFYNNNNNNNKYVSPTNTNAHSSSASSNTNVSTIILSLFFIFLLIIGFFYIQTKNALPTLPSSNSLAPITSLISGILGLFSNAFSTVMSQLLIMFVGIIVASLIGSTFYLGNKFWTYKNQYKLRAEKELFDMIDRILELLQSHSDMAKEAGEDAFMAVNHIRDAMILPQDRIQKKDLWNRVVKYISENESRVREEIQHISGEENRVWRWLPTASPLSGRRSIRGNVSGNKSLSFLSDGTESGQNKWQGQAFEMNDGNPNALTNIPTTCLKIRHMYDQERTGENKIEKAILEKCDDAKIIHIGVEPNSPEGLVYVKCASKDDAGKVYMALHGWWYEGHLLSVKFLREERYYARYPDAKKQNVFSSFISL